MPQSAQQVADAVAAFQPLPRELDPASYVGKPCQFCGGENANGFVEGRADAPLVDTTIQPGPRDSQSETAADVCRSRHAVSLQGWPLRAKHQATIRNAEQQFERLDRRNESNATGGSASGLAKQDEDVLTMLFQGEPQRRIAAELDMHLSSVQRAVRRLKKSGRWPAD